MGGDFSGIYPPIATPFFEDGTIDYNALFANIERWNATDLTGYVVFGSNGESVHLSGSEKTDLVSRVTEYARGKQVIAGTGEQSTAATIEMTKACADAGADAALIINPSFYTLSRRDLIAHYFAVADDSPIPVLIYNVPKFTGANIDCSTVTELASHPNIVGIKDSSGDVTQISSVIRETPDDFSVLSGTINVLHPVRIMGASGAITALANIAPEKCLRLYELSSKGLSEEAAALQLELIPPNTAVTKTFGIPGLKAAMTMTGYVGGWPRPPLKPMSEEDRVQLNQILATADLV